MFRKFQKLLFQLRNIFIEFIMMFQFFSVNRGPEYNGTLHFPRSRSFSRRIQSTPYQWHRSEQIHTSEYEEHHSR